jgi:lia operon protein LiaI
MALGILMLLGFLGINVGWIIALVIPSFFVYQGWKLFTKRESKVKKGFGIALMIVGLIWLTGMLHVLIGLAIAAFLIYYGMKMINKNKSFAFSPEVEVSMGEGFAATSSATEFSYKDYDYLDEWEKELNKNNTQK